MILSKKNYRVRKAVLKNMKVQINLIPLAILGILGLENIDPQKSPENGIYQMKKAVLSNPKVQMNSFPLTNLEIPIQENMDYVESLEKGIRQVQKAVPRNLSTSINQNLRKIQKNLNLESTENLEKEIRHVKKVVPKNLKTLMNQEPQKIMKNLNFKKLTKRNQQVKKLVAKSLKTRINQDFRKILKNLNLESMGNMAKEMRQVKKVILKKLKIPIILFHSADQENQRQANMNLLENLAEAIMTKKNLKAPMSHRANPLNPSVKNPLRANHQVKKAVPMNLNVLMYLVHSTNHENQSPANIGLLKSLAKEIQQVRKIESKNLKVSINLIPASQENQGILIPAHVDLLVSLAKKIYELKKGVSMNLIHQVNLKNQNEENLDLLVSTAKEIYQIMEAILKNLEALIMLSSLANLEVQSLEYTDPLESLTNGIHLVTETGLKNEIPRVVLNIQVVLI